MKVINTGNIYRVYDDTMQTFEKFPVKVYKIGFSPQSGFFVEGYQDIETKDKVYGVIEDKASKVLKSFEKMPKNLGVILSGPKGIGKSLTAKLIIEKSLNSGFPVFIIDTYYPGISSYINQIEQECVVLFDEFDKTFCGQMDDRNTASDPQTEMLSLFDGIGIGKKLFIITCNDLNNLNNFLVNRPGRFHYHFRFEYPTNDEITLYLKDNLDKEYWDEIDKVVQFANKVNLNYDCLRAIVFELSNGEKFKDAIRDLNIVNTEHERYDVTIHFESGQVANCNSITIDMFSSEMCRCDIYAGNWLGMISFVPSECQYNVELGCYCANLEHTNWEPDDDEDCKDMLKQYQKVTMVTVKRKFSNNIHYLV